MNIKVILKQDLNANKMDTLIEVYQSGWLETIRDCVLDNPQGIKLGMSHNNNRRNTQ